MNTSRELSTLRSLQQGTVSAYVPRLLDSFTHTGPNGIHLCLVTEFLGPSLDHVVADYHQGGDRLDPEIVLKLSKQLLQAIELIHGAGYGHGGE